MRIWIAEVAEPLPLIDGNFRDLRCGILAKMLVNAGHEVLWWTSTFCHPTKTHRFMEAHSIEYQPGLHMRLLHGPGYKRNISLQRIKHNRIIAAAFAQETQKRPEKPDLIFTCVPVIEIAEKAMEYAQSHNIPIIADARDQWPDHYLTAIPSPLHPLAKLVLKAEFQRVARVFQGVTGITAMANSLLEWGLQYAEREQRATDGVFPLGYRLHSPENVKTAEAQNNAGQNNYGIRSDALVVTFIGQFGSSYDFETILKAAKRLQENQSNVQFVLVGAGDQESRLRKAAQDLDNILFTGWLDDVSMSDILQLSSVGLIPYAPHATYFMGNKSYQYMAAGLPIIASAGVNLKAAVQDENIGLLYKSGNTESFMEAIQWMATHKSKREEMGKRAYRLLEEKFDVEIVYRSLIKHMETLVHRHQSNRAE